MSDVEVRTITLSRPLLLLVLLSLGLCAISWYLVFGMSPRTVPQHPSTNKEWFSVGTQGDTLGKFQQPRGVTGFPDGSFVVVDRAARVQHFSAEGKPLKLWSMKEHDLGNPKGVTALPDGHMLVCDTHYGRVLKMSVDGRIIQKWGGPGRGPSEFTHPLSAVCDAQRGVVYVVEYGDRNDRVQKFDLEGKFLKSWGTFGTEPGTFQRPSGIALDLHGHLFVADACNHRIQKFDSDGNLLKAFGEIGDGPGQLRYPYDIACAPDGLLYVAEFNGHRVSVFDGEGNFVRHIGSVGSNPGEFAHPWALTIDARGRLLVSDTGNHRVQIFELNEKVARVAAKEVQAQPDVLKSQQ